MLVAGELAARGVEVAGPAGGRTGVVVAIAAAGERTMVSDRGSAPELAPDELQPEWFRCDALHVSGYALMREPVAAAALAAGELARAAGAQVSLDLSSWTLIDDAFRDERVRSRPTSSSRSSASATRYVAMSGELAARWVVKRGADGVVADGVAYPAVPTEVVDATGAGDAFAAGFLVGGVEAGLEAAARCCAKLGAMP